MINRSAILSFAAIATLSACATTPPTTPQSAFMAQLRTLCGKAFEGRMMTNDARDADIGSQRLIMHVRSCTAEEIRIPFHVGEDRSRTWVLTTTATGLRLKHDHRHADGKPDDRTLYGGDTVNMGTSARQEFPADGESKELFTRTGTPNSNTNVWAVEVSPAASYIYEVKREGRHLRVEFNLTREVPIPPAPWGS
jgi:hypothetical protein